MEEVKRHFGKILLALLVIATAWHYWSIRPVHHPAGVLVPEEPVQDPPTAGAFTFKNYMISPLANFDIRARVLSTERYYLDDSSKLSPVDFALGWGPMSDTAFLDRLDISQGHRWWMWSYEGSLNEADVSNHAANMHMIPATPAIERVLLHVRVGQIVHIGGELVGIRGDNGFTWSSSLTRTDTGDHSCEVIFVQSVEATNL